MGRLYVVPYAGTITNAGGDVDLFEIAPADDKPIKLRGFCLGQTSEVGDAAEEGLRISVIRLPATFTSGSGGSTPVGSPMDSADSAHGATLEANNTTVGTTSGTAITLYDYAWNLRNSPFEVWYPDDRFCPKVKQTEGLVIRQQTTAADDYSFAGYVVFEEE